MEAVDHYIVLGVPMGASVEQVRAAYQARLQEMREAVRSGNPPSAHVVDRLRKAFILVHDVACRAQHPTLQEPALQPESPAERMTAPEEAASPRMDGAAAIEQALYVDVALPSEFRLSFVGKGEEYFRIWIVNLFLSIITLGIYSVWAKVRREKYFHHSLMLEGSTFDYHGSPRAILKGRAVAVLIFGALSIAQHFSPKVHGGLILLLVPFVPWFAVRAFRFRAHNTSYRGIRFAFLGSYREAMVAIIGYGLVTLVTLGLAYPYWYAKLRLFMLNNLAYGTARLASPVTASQVARALVMPMLGSGALFLVLGVIFAVIMGGLSAAAQAGAAHKGAGAPALSPLIMLAPFFLMALAVSFMVFVKGLFVVRIGNLLLEGASLGHLELRSRLALKPYISIAMTNWLLILLTLGLFIPFAHIRMACYRAEALGVTAQGGLDEFVGGEQVKVSALGDEASEVFDLDIAL